MEEGRGAVLLANVCAKAIQIVAESKIETSTVGPASVAEIQEMKAEEAQDVWEQLKLEDNEIPAAGPTALNEVKAMIYNCLVVFSVPTAWIDCMGEATFKAGLQPGAQPVRQKVQPLKTNQERSREDQLQLWTDKGVIECISFPRDSPLVPVIKKTVETRWNEDYGNLEENLEGQLQLLTDKGVIGSSDKENCGNQME